MRRLLAFAGILSLAALAALTARPAAAQQRVERGWPLDPDGAVKVYNFVGRVRIVAWDRDSVAVTGTIPATHRFFGGGARGGVKFGVDGDQRELADAAVFEVRVPAGANVWVRGAATDIEASGLIGIVDIGTVSGRVVVTGAPRSLTAESMSGAVEVRGSPETLRAKTASGALTWDGGAQDAHLVSVSGTIRVAGGALERARVESVTGAVRLAASLRPDARVTIETHAGEVELFLPRAAPLRLDADVARISGAGVSRTRDQQGGGPQQLTFHLAKGSTAAPLVTVRSFKGGLVVAFGK